MFKEIKFKWVLVVTIIAALVVPVMQAVPAQAITSYELVAFGVALNPAGTSVTDIGWARGNSDKGWREGDWIPCRAKIVVDQGQYPNLTGFPDIKVGYDYTSGNQSDDPRFIDLVRDIQIGTSQLTDAQGWPKPDGSAYDTGNPPTMPTLAQVRTAQTSPGENQWSGYTLLSSLAGPNAWNPTAQVNVDYSGGAGLPSTESHQFIITGNQVREIFSGNLSVTTFYVYFQFHLARSFVWENGIESGYNASPSDNWGGWLYGNPEYTPPDPVDVRQGSGFAPGSSGHMYFNIQGVGKDTTQLPVPPEPTGAISGTKWLDSNSDGVMDPGEPGISGWDIHIWFYTPDSILFEAHVTTDINGNYQISDLTPGIWYLAEHQNLINTSGWSQTYPGGTVNILPGGESHLFTDFPFTHPDVGPWGWFVTLTDNDLVQADIDFGNISSAPSTTTTIDAAATIILTGTSTTLTVTEQNNGNVDLTGIYVELEKDGLPFGPNLVAPPTSGDGGVPGTLEVGETWVWSGIPTGNLSASSTTFTATGHGLDPNENDITFENGFGAEQGSVIVNAINPSTTMTVFTTTASIVYSGGTVTLVMSDYNDGDMPLVAAHVHLYANAVLLPAPYDEMDSSSPYFSGGDTNNNGLFDPGETWTWTVTLIVNDTTSFRVTGHGTDTLGNAVDYPEYPSETLTLDVTAIDPNTEVTITANETAILFNSATTLEVTESNPNTPNAVTLTNVYVVVLKNGNLFATLTAAGPNPPGTVFAGDTIANGELDPGETWSWSNIPTGIIAADTIFQATGHGTDPLLKDITAPEFPGEEASTEVDILIPSTTVSIAAYPPHVFYGNTLTLVVTEKNSGSIDLSNVYVDISGGATFHLTSTGPQPPGIVFSGDGPVLNILDASGGGETWQWIISNVPVAASSSFIATGYGEFGGPPPIAVTYPEYGEERDQVYVDVIPLEAPATSDIGTGLLIGGFVVLMAILGYRRLKRA